MADDSDIEREKTKQHLDQHYDESLDVPDAEEVASIYTPTPRVPKKFGVRGQSRGNTPPKATDMDDNSDDDFDTGQPAEPPARIKVSLPEEDRQQKPPPSPEDDDDDDSDDDDDDAENDVKADGNDDDDDDESDDDSDEDDDSVAATNVTSSANVTSLGKTVPALSGSDARRASVGQEGRRSSVVGDLRYASIGDISPPKQAHDSSQLQTGGAAFGGRGIPPIPPVGGRMAAAAAPQIASAPSMTTLPPAVAGSSTPASLPIMKPLGMAGVAPPPGAGQPGAGGQQMYNDEDDDEDEESGSTDDEDDDEGSNGQVEGAYDPADYEHLPVTPEIKELFQYITRYTPQTIELEHKLKPFIPDFIPAVGDIDAFLKIPRVDAKPDTLGLTVLDEPCAKQSDPTVLDLQLRAVSKQTNLKAVVVKSIDNAEKNPRAVDNWIQSISEIHRSRPPPNVHYTKNMPDIEMLMQEWPSDFEELLKEISLPSADLDCDLSTYVDMVCAILDIPIYKSKIQSLHVLFTLYSEFKNSQHFRSLAAENKLDNALKGMQDDMLGGMGEESDQLIL